jgi:hypothetical protein
VRALPELAAAFASGDVRPEERGLRTRALAEHLTNGERRERDQIRRVVTAPVHDAPADQDRLVVQRLDVLERSGREVLGQRQNAGLALPPPNLSGEPCHSLEPARASAGVQASFAGFSEDPGLALTAHM